MNFFSISNRYGTRAGWLLSLCIHLMLFTGCHGPLGDKSVHPGINDHYKKNPNAQTWVPRFERESREIFTARHDIISAMNLQPGMHVADVGAGTGLFTGMIAEKVGSSGHVYAVDVVPNFLTYIEQRVAKEGYNNVTTVRCHEDSVDLPSASIDLLFICDTYHHLEYPTSSLQSIWQALRPGGIVVVVDFYRIPGVSRDWIIDHVRAGLDVVRAEFEQEGFEYAGFIDVDGLKENYMARFRRP